MFMRAAGEEAAYPAAAFGQLLNEKGVGSSIDAEKAHTAPIIPLPLTFDEL